MTDSRSTETDLHRDDSPDGVSPFNEIPVQEIPVQEGKRLPVTLVRGLLSPQSRPEASAQGFPWMVSLFAFIVMLSFFLPYTVERITYSIVRGRQRAGYDTAGEELKNAPLSDLSAAYQLVARRVGPSVVHITVAPISAAELQQFPQRSISHHPSTGLGSGVVVDQDGYIVTNEHVVRGAKEIRVKLSDGRIVLAEIVGVDRPTDVAVLKVDEGNLMAAQWGDSDQLEVGALVWALGSPFGLEHSITFGILSAKHRSGIRKVESRMEVVDSPYQDFLQTDAAVNPGNSGGPLVDSSGRVVGINTAIVGEAYQGISFAVPSRVAKGIYERIRREGKVTRGWLGVRPQEITPELAKQLGLTDRRGALVAALPRPTDGTLSPALQAGIEPSDVIVQWDGQPVDSCTDLFSRVAMTKVGSTVEIEVIRSGQRITLNVTVTQRGREGRVFVE